MIIKMQIKTVPKVWGEERVIVNNRYCGKILVLKAFAKGSLHFHKWKEETFYILKGRVLLEIDGDKTVGVPRQAFLIKPGQKHRFTGLADSEIIEFSMHHDDADTYRITPSEAAK
jgi:quercetin dioxygenase-like cupin family protein